MLNLFLSAQADNLDCFSIIGDAGRELVFDGNVEHITLLLWLQTLIFYLFKIYFDFYF